ncbi:hypothetical protein BLX87_23170 [Bacillus sp. VT-16-64]|nr:hypothetical protein BLX87_23170 [Bacillus sp. VT-16-64]
MTSFTEMYTSLKILYKNMMFPQNPDARKWTMTEIDQLDVHFFHDLMDFEHQQPQEKEVYLSDIW